MFFGTALIDDEQKIIVANKKRDKFFTMDYLSDELDFEPYSELLEFIWENDEKVIEKIKDFIETNDGDIADIAEVELMPAIPYPLRNVFCMGLNYKAHVAESNQKLPTEPVYFSKAAFVSSGPGDEISVYSSLDRKADYEAELIVVIGKEAIDVEKANAEDYIFGYAVGNDFSIRNTQMDRGQWFYGKSYDGHFTMGNWIAHKSMFPLPIEVNIKCFVNGEERQSSNTKYFIFDIPTALNDLTKGVTLYPGDMLMTGTPSGVGIGLTPPQFLKAGDIVKSEIEGIEAFENKMCD
ncbi:MAG: fumarylacetoacetate hydrolase family protein [Eubacteriaceae bacterium]|nr:fumarylacetoacetate hydrolase family protein [Eubacteriaceae bacterium]